MHEVTGIVRREREGMFEKRHPWVFSGAIHSTTGDPADGDIVALRTSGGAFLARGYWNHHSQINVHILTWNEDEPIDDAFWRSRLERAIRARALPGIIPHSCRLVNADNDGFPGLIVDRYADWLVVQALTLGIDRRKQQIANLLMELLAPAGIYERSDADVRGKEGLTPAVGLLAGQAPPPLIEIEANGRRLLVDVYNA